jgi:hypothetical protein
MSKSNHYLIAGGVMSALISLLHVFLAVFPALYKFVGPDQSALTEMAAQGSSITTTVSVALALLFAVWALYAFSGAGMIRPFPLLRIALITISVIYLLRALFLLSEIGMVVNQGYPFRFLVFSTISLVAGLLYLFGILRQRTVLTTHGRGRKPV